MKFLGYARPDGSVGIRNYVLVIAVTRAVHILAAKISEHVNGTKVFVAGDEDGKSSRDRDTLSRVFIGLGCNANTASVLIVCNKRDAGYEQLKAVHIAEMIGRTGKTVEVLAVDEHGGYYQSLGEGIKIARRLVREASAIMRTEADIGKLVIGVKCGLSDATSGISGNPVAGRMADLLIAAGGTLFFSETTEVIGAEEILAQRCVDSKVKKEFLEAVYETEACAKATGEDIRTINPIPANIEAGITTLEEKSLGAMAKTGKQPICGVLKYAQRQSGKGLYFVDSWMSSTSLFLGYAAAGANLVIFQMGGAALPPDPPMPAVATGLVAPIYYMTGNPYTYNRSRDEIDFDAGTIIEKTESIEKAGERLLQDICQIAAGKLTKMETFNYQDQMEVYLHGPNL